MFPYDSDILAALQGTPQTISDVLDRMRAIDRVCINEDGLKWFNGLYLSVTQAVETRVAGGGFAEPRWLAQLDAQFAGLYFSALRAALAGDPCPGCWAAMFAGRADIRISRIQFALAGMNAHINHDLCLAIEATCKATGTLPQHGTQQYNDYTSVNSTLDELIGQAKQNLKFRLPGEALPAVSHLDDLMTSWDIGAAREKAWENAETLWNLPPSLAAGLLDSIDGLTCVISKALLVPVP